MVSLRDTFPLLARHEGLWEGWYRYLDIDGNQTDAHRARLTCRILDDQPHIYHQTNHYTWDDGRTDIRDFKGHAEGSRLILDNDIIKGWSAEVPEDNHGRTMMLHWTRVGEPGIYLYEMIQLSDCGNHRARVWQWLKDGKTIQRTLIDETRISDDWRGT